MDAFQLQSGNHAFPYGTSLLECRDSATAEHFLSSRGIDMLKCVVHRFRITRILALVSLLPLASILTLAQTSAQERAASLRTQLVDVEQKQGELQDKLKALEEDLKPENIEHSLAGVGSTRPEELREQKRRELEIQKKGVQSQLNQLAASHTRLEKAIAEADTQVYQQSASPSQNTQTKTAPVNVSQGPPDQSSVNPPTDTQRRKAKRTRRSRRRPNN